MASIFHFQIGPRWFAVISTLVFVLAVAAPAAKLAAAPSDPQPPVKGQPEKAPTDLNEEGMDRYRAHDYRHAVEIFLRAYALEPDPNLLFNIARCYEAMGESDVAAEKYRTFLEDPAADPDGKTRAKAALVRLRQPADTTPVGAPALGAGAPAGDPVMVPEPQTSGLKDRGAPETSPAGDGRRTWRWVALGSGIAVVAAGGTLYYLGGKDYDKIRGAPGFGDPAAVDPMTEGEAQRLADSGHWKKVAGGIALGVGAAALATSVVMFVVQDAPHRDNIALRLVPSTTGARLIFEGRF